MTRKNAHLVLACWQAWTWLHELTSLNMVELASLNMVELASLNRVVDRFVHACWDRQLFMAAWWTNRLEQRCSYMIEVEHVVREWWNNKTEQRCYNNHELGCCIKSGFACSNIYEYVETWLNNTVILLISCSIMLTASAVAGLLSPQPCYSLWYFYARIIKYSNVCLVISEP